MRVGTNSPLAVDISRSEVGKMKESLKKCLKKEIVQERLKTRLRMVQLHMKNNSRNEGSLASKPAN